MESTPEAYVARMVEVFREVRRVLREDGLLWLNIGFSYDGRGNLVDQPSMLRDGLVADGWYCKAQIVWAKPNPMPESVDSRPTKAHEIVWLMARDAATDYFYDATAIAEPLDRPEEAFRKTPARFGGADKWPEAQKQSRLHSGNEYLGTPTGTRNARDVWTIASAPYKEAHFATFPPELVRRCILAGTSERGCCPTCGAPWERIVEATGGTIGKSWHDHANDAGAGMSQVKDVGWRSGDYQRRTTGWRPTCEHGGETTIPCTVLDPFMGSGTSALVAQSLNRRWVGIDLSEEYAALAQDRCGTVNLAMAI